MAFRGRHRGTRGVAVVVLVAASIGVGATAASAAPDVVETTLTMTSDPATPGSALLHAELVGAYVDAGGEIPAGTWSFLVADDTGAALFTKEVAQPAGGPTSIDVVWADVPAGIVASGIVSYVPNEASDQVEFAGATAAFASEGTPAQATELSRTETTQAPTQSAPDSLTIWLGILVGMSLLAAAVGIALLARRDRRSTGDRA